MRHASILIAATLVAGCGDDGATSHPDAAPDAYVIPWFHPMPGEAKNWDVQLAAPYDVSAARAMYDLDLFALVPAATTIDYGDGAPVTVPAGALAGKLAELHARTPRTTVICHIDTGAIRLTDPDAAKFPGFEATPPDNPTPPKPGSVIGWKTSDPAKRYLDSRAASRSRWLPIILKRFDLAKQIGCDGIEPDRMDAAPSFNPGFDITASDLTSFYQLVAMEAHTRVLSVGMKNLDEIPGQTDQLSIDFDWAMPERCGEFVGCDNLRPFLNKHKAVFSLEYQTDVDGLPQTTSTLCTRNATEQIEDALVKDAALTSAFRMECTP